MTMEWIYFVPGEEPEAFTMNMCERLFDGAHEDCPGWMKYDSDWMEPAKATERDVVFCICPCHKKPQA
jgi:hypothetical protein